MAVNIDVQIAEQNASVELPSNPDAELSTSGAQQMAQELTQSPKITANLQNAINIQSVSDAVTYYGSIPNFSVVDVDGVPIAAESSTDMLQLSAGEGIELDVDGKEITITSTGVSSPRLGYDTVDNITYLSVLED